MTPPEAGYYASGDSLHAWDIVQSRVSCQLIGCSVDWAPALVTWYTSDGGVSWLQGGFLLGGVPDFRPIAMQFVDDATGWFLYVDQVGMSGFTYQSLVGTTDWGASWKLLHPFSNGCVSGGMVFLDGQNGWIGNDCRWLTNSLDPIPLQDFLSGKAAPSLNRTLDGGISWTEYAPPAPAAFPPKITSAKEGTGFYCGVAEMDRISAEAFILQWYCTTGYPDTSVSVEYAYLTDDGGQTWRSWLSTGNERFINPTTGWRLLPGSDGQPGLLQQTTDGGSTWQTIKSVAWQSAKFDFTSELVGWAIVGDGANFALVRTSDGGIFWVQLKPVTNK